ncbi:hypothetical protein [Luteolibacter marinus]|uniref:hypothetical protein n=1 Tax=Luteolibacter marinus TaxID=2776705 RepID=UPI0018679F09|nr:hypothetical protein [Luteolibacter marinus]
MNPKKLSAPALGGIAVLAVTLIDPLSGQSVWTGGVDSAWNNADNWNPAGVPGTATDVVVDSSASHQVDIPVGNWSRQGAGTTTISGTGVINLQTGSARFLNWGTFTVAAGGAFNHTGEYFLVGNGGLGSFVQSGGTVTSNHSRGFFLSDNNASQLGTTYTLTGGVLTVNSQATYNAGNLVDRRLRSVWFGKGGEGAVDASVTGDLFTVNGGTANFTRIHATSTSDVLVSRNSGIAVESGTATFRNYVEFRVGYGMGGTDNSGTNPAGPNNSHVTVSGGLMNVAGGTPMVLGYADNGSLLVSGGTLALSGEIRLGGPLAGSGFVVQTGGVITATDVAFIAGFYDFGGGFLRLAGDRTSILEEDWFSTFTAPDTVVADYDPVTDRTTIHVTGESLPASTYAVWSAENANGGDFDADNDGDGVPNGAEYFFGELGAGFTANPAVAGGEITWPRDPAVTDAAFVVETSTSLGQGEWSEVLEEDLDLSQPDAISYTLPTPGGGSPKLFVRLRVTSQAVASE